jgi:acetyl esterase/lipase
MRKTLVHCLMTALLALAAAQPASAQDNSKMKPTAIPAQPSAIPLETGALPGATAKESWHSQYGSAFARNVTEATLTPFLPDPAKATGAAVIVAPGGGFRTLSMQNEGWDVAKALAARGIAAFVLKYRLNQTPASLEEFEKPTTAAPRPRTSFNAERMITTLAPQIADARAAFALVRARSSEWKVDPKRVGMVGFSAGAMLAMVTTLGGVDAKPAFIGDIYGPLEPVKVPADAPPLFAALAADDPLFAGRGMGLIDSWVAAKKPIEFHLYGQGGHGFGMYPKETTSTGWFDAFYKWIVMNGFTKPSA